MNKPLDVILLDGIISGNPDDHSSMIPSPFKRFFLFFVPLVPVLCFNVVFFLIHHCDSVMAKVAPVPFASTVIVLLNGVRIG